MPVTFLLVDQTSPNFFLFDPVEIVLSQVCFRVLISQSVLKIFADKVQRCPKSSRIFEFFGPPKFLGCGLLKEFVHK